MATPWLTSDSLVAAIERKIAAPVSQNLFSAIDYLAFCNEEMMIGTVPQVLQFNSEYFVTTKTVALEANKSRYAIPERAIGQKFRDLFYIDENNNPVEMTRIDSSNRAYFNNSGVNVSTVSQYYIEGNDVVLVPGVQSSPVGSIMFVYFLRPSQLVPNDNAAICTGFQQTITVDVTTLIAGDEITVGDKVLTAVAGAPSTDEFQINVSNSVVASNLASAITTYTSATASASSAVVTVSYSSLGMALEASNVDAFDVQETQGVVFDAVPENIADGELVDFLQTKSGHKIRGMDVEIPSGGVSSNVINFDADDVPEDFIVGDYVALANECIIPQIPTDLHTALAERACARILSAIGDQQGLQATNEKLQEIEVRQGNLLDNRVANQPTKVLARKSLLRYGKSGRWWSR